MVRALDDFQGPLGFCGYGSLSMCRATLNILLSGAHTIHHQPILIVWQSLDGNSNDDVT